MFKVVKISIKNMQVLVVEWLLGSGLIFVVWDLLAVRPVFLPSKLHQDKDLKHRAGYRRVWRPGESDLVCGKEFECPWRVGYHIAF